MTTAIISKLSHDGRGIVTSESGKKVFVDGALPGEEVNWQYVKKHRKYDEAKVTEVITASQDRVEAPCPNFLTCGGCSYQHMSQQSQLQYKQNTVIELLQHFGNNHLPKTWLSPLQAKTTGYRTKARLGVRYVFKKQKILIGFREKATNYLTEMDTCSVLTPELNYLLKPLGELIANLSIYNQVAQVEFAMGDADEHVVGRNIVVILRNLAELNEADYFLLNSFNKTYNINLLLQHKGPESLVTLNGSAITDLFYRFEYKSSAQNFEITYFFSPHDFTQVNLSLNSLMLNQAIDLLNLQGHENILDLFCGLGNFTLPMAKMVPKGKVIGIEGTNQMVVRGQANAAHNNITNTEFYCANLYDKKLLEELIQSNFYLDHAKKYDCIILDPPRSGALELLPYLAQLSAKKILYISCDPATFARDVGVLCSDYGYELQTAGIMDMFPHTKHVETIGLLIKKQP